MILAFGIWLDVPCVLQKSGLANDQPPEEIHVMARGPIAAAGGLYEADLVFDALASVGVDIAEIGAALDFGCSSGRVVRVLHAAYPETRWHGCDPNGPAIAWAHREPARDRVLRQRRRAAAAAGRRLARHGLRDLDLVALRARCSACAGSRRCTA